MQLGVEVYWHPGEATFVIRGELDGPAATDLTERLTEVGRVIRVLNGEPGRLVVDLAGVKGVDQAAARAFAAARQQLSPDCSLVIESPSPAARKHLASVGLVASDPGAESPAKPERAARESGRVPGSRAPGSRASAARDSGRKPRAAKPRLAKTKGRGPA